MTQPPPSSKAPDACQGICQGGFGNECDLDEEEEDMDSWEGWY